MGVKLKLDLDDLVIDSFATTPEVLGDEGTIYGQTTTLSLVLTCGTTHSCETSHDTCWTKCAPGCVTDVTAAGNTCPDLTCMGSYCQTAGSPQCATQYYGCY